MPQEFNLKANFQDMTDLKDGLVKLRECQYVSGDVEHYVKYSWAIKDAEASLTKRARLAEVIYRLFGDRIEEDPSYSEALAEAKVLKADLDALAAEEAAADA